jgi:hypothetical protein
MVITARKLESEMGINSEIAHYFANERKVPTDNLFWSNKRIYISIGFGYLTIPLMFDLVHKSGVPVNMLLQDAHVTLMEKGFDKLKRYENNEITFPEFLSACKVIVQDNVKQPHLAADLFAAFSGKETRYFQFETKHKALARSDSFLFTIVDLDLTDDWVHSFLPIWYSLARPILLLDDFKDLVEDRINLEENTIIELGDNGKAVAEAYNLGMADVEILSKVNPQLAKYMAQFLKEALRYEHISSMLD